MVKWKHKQDVHHNQKYLRYYQPIYPESGRIQICYWRTRWAISAILCE